MPIAAPRIEDERASGALREAVVAYTVPQDLVGLPACVLPNGMQLTGPPGSEALLLAAASALVGEYLPRNAALAGESRAALIGVHT